jgi:hypothetical protein
MKKAATSLHCRNSGTADPAVSNQISSTVDRPSEQIVACRIDTRIGRKEVTEGDAELAGDAVAGITWLRGCAGHYSDVASWCCRFGWGCPVAGGLVAGLSSVEFWRC